MTESTALIVKNLNGKRCIDYEAVSDDALATRFPHMTTAILALQALEGIYPEIRALNCQAFPVQTGEVTPQLELPL